MLIFYTNDARLQSYHFKDKILNLVDEESGSKDSHDDSQWAGKGGAGSAWWGAIGCLRGRRRGGRGGATSASGGTHGSSRFSVRGDCAGSRFRLASGGLRLAAGGAAWGRGGWWSSRGNRSWGSGGIRAVGEAVRVVVVVWVAVVGDSDRVIRAGWEVGWGIPRVDTSVVNASNDSSNWGDCIRWSAHENQSDLITNGVGPLDINGLTSGDRVTSDWESDGICMHDTSGRAGRSRDCGGCNASGSLGGSEAGESDGNDGGEESHLD